MRTVKSSIRQSGGAIVEFVVVLPLLLLLIIATAELGRAFYQYNTLTKAVRDGARYLATQAILGDTDVIPPDIATSNNYQQLRTRTSSLVVCGRTSCGATPPLLPGLVLEDVTITRLNATHIVVSAAYDYEPILDYPIPDTLCMPTFECINFGFTLNASVTMRAL